MSGESGRDDFVTQTVTLGLDIGGTHVRMGLVDPSGELTHFTMYKTADFIREGFVGTLSNTILSYLDAHLNSRPLHTVSMGFPSAIDKTCRVLYSTPSIPGLSNIDIVSEMENRLHLPVCISRDVNMLYLYDARRYSLPNEGVVIGVYFGTGIGNAIAINGQLLKGKNGVAGELGHIPVWGKSDACGCGNDGCMELYAAGQALARLRSTHFADTPMEDVFARHGGDERLDDYLEAMTLPLATEINLLDPEAVVLGGGVLQMKGFPRDVLERKLRAHVRKPYPESTLNLIYSDLQQKNGVIGAGYYGFMQ